MGLGYGQPQSGFKCPMLCKISQPSIHRLCNATTRVVADGLLLGSRHWRKYGARGE